MWIRSQDKEKLVFVKTRIILSIHNGSYKNDEKMIYDTLTTIQDDVYIELGKYKTKERALEVLDDIQVAVLSQNYVEVEISNTRVDNISRTVVYEMPQD